MTLYPEQAQAKGLTGDAVVRCEVVDLNGHLDRCVIISESPEGQGFGEKAIGFGRWITVKPGETPEWMDGPRLRPDAKAQFRVQFRFNEDP